MSPVLSNHDVLTLEEAAAYLRVSEELVESLALRRELPARRLGEDWRFLKSALQEWLRGRNDKETLLRQAGALANDPSLPEMLKRIYNDRGRPELDVG